MKSGLPVVVALVLATAACDHKDEPKAPGGGSALIVAGGLQHLLDSNATLVGFLNEVEPPYVHAAFRDGWLEWSTDKQRRSLIQGRADVYNRPDMKCLGFEYKRLSVPGRAERYLVCEAIQELRLSNVLPRSQDFVFPSGALFFEYEPPKEIGYPQYYFLAIEK